MEKLIPVLIWLIASLLGKTWRVRVVAPPSVDPFNAGAAPKVYCFWHSALLVICYAFRNTGKTALISRSRDGRVAAEVARRWGYGAVLGSSARGGASAMRQGIRVIRDGGSLGITPDGPKGPREVVKPGAAQIAVVSRAPVVTIRVDAGRAWRLKSWDRFMIPKPFARITLVLSEPIEPPGRDNLTRGGVDDYHAGDVNAGDDPITAMTRSIQENMAL